jgi:hypothetical protein
MNIRDSNGTLGMSAVRKGNDLLADVLSQRQKYPSVVEKI